MNAEQAKKNAWQVVSLLNKKFNIFSSFLRKDAETFKMLPEIVNSMEKSVGRVSGARLASTLEK